MYSLLIDFGYFPQIIVSNHKTIVPKLIWLCTYDLHVRGFVASNEVVLVESIATPTLLLSFPDGFPGFKMKIYYYELLYLNSFLILPANFITGSNILPILTRLVFW